MSKIIQIISATLSTVTQLRSFRTENAKSNAYSTNQFTVLETAYRLMEHKLAVLQWMK
jgi:hypothetical protein